MHVIRHMSTTIQIRISEAEKQAWRSHAAFEGCNDLSTWIRKRCNEKRGGLTFEELSKLEHAKLEVKLNQYKLSLEKEVAPVVVPEGNPYPNARLPHPSLINTDQVFPPIPPEDPPVATKLTWDEQMALDAAEFAREEAALRDRKDAQPQSAE